MIADTGASQRREGHYKRINEGLLKLGHDHARNIQILTSLCGELLQADCALYNRLEGDLLRVKGQWAAPLGLRTEDTARGHICFDVIRHDANQPLVIGNLQETDYA